MDFTFIKNHKFELSGIVLVIAGILLFISTLGVFFPSEEFTTDSDSISGILDYLGNWDYWLFIVSAIVFALCLWIFFDFILKMRKFTNYLKTSSKSTFKKNNEDIQYLAWELGDKFIDRYEERKKELRIRD